MNDYGIENDANYNQPQEEATSPEININKGDNRRVQREAPKQPAKDEWDDDDDLNTGL